MLLQRSFVYRKRISYIKSTYFTNGLIHHYWDHGFPTRVLRNTRNFRINKYTFLNMGKNCKNRSKYFRNFCPAVWNTGVICHQKCMTGLETLLLSSHQIQELYSDFKNDSWLNYSVIKLWRYNSRTWHVMCYGLQQK